MRVTDFGEIRPLMTGIAIVIALIFCSVGALFIKVDLFTMLNPDHPQAKRDKNFHKKFGITFVVFALVWLAFFCWPSINKSGTGEWNKCLTLFNR